MHTRAKQFGLALMALGIVATVLAEFRIGIRCEGCAAMRPWYSPMAVAHCIGNVAVIGWNVVALVFAAALESTGDFAADFLLGATEPGILPTN